MDHVVAAVTRVLMLPLQVAHLIPSERWLQVGLLAVTVVVVALAWRYQRCPHCRAMVPRAGALWLRCTRCGRQYHRGLRRVA
jgi:tRNA(Ile2) C34 agmatinyltransferase TiaS